MEIYLIRHTKPDIVKGTCYGQADIGTTDSFLYEASCIQQHIPAGIQTVYSSPLRRCRQLAEFLFPQQVIFLDDRLKEIQLVAYSAAAGCCTRFLCRLEYAVECRKPRIKTSR